MAAELITPVDLQTGIPLSVAPSLELLPRNNPDKANWHHLYHPSTAPELQTIGGMALRNSRVQLIAPRDHNTGRHTYHTFYKGPVLADNEDDQFRLCVLSSGGYLPNEVIDLKGTEPKVRPITEAERAAFMAPPKPMSVRKYDITHYRMTQIALGRASRVVNLTDQDIRQILEERNQKQASMSYNSLQYGYDSVRRFFQHYALKQPLSHIKESVLDEFMFTPDEHKRQTLGHWLLAKQAEVAAEVVRDTYAAARRGGALHPSMPRDPSTFIKFKLGSPGRREELFGQLDDALIMGNIA